MIKFAFLNILIIGLSFIITEKEGLPADNNEYIIENKCSTLFFDLALGHINYDEYFELLVHCYVEKSCPEGEEYYEMVACMGSSDCSTYNDGEGDEGVECDSHQTSCNKCIGGSEVCQSGN